MKHRFIRKITALFLAFGLCFSLASCMVQDEQGIQGEQGLQGIQGIQGIQGVQGEQTAELG